MSLPKNRPVLQTLSLILGSLLSSSCSDSIQASINRADTQWVGDDAAGALRAYRATLARVEAKLNRSVGEQTQERYLLTRIGELCAYYRQDPQSAVFAFSALAKRYPESPEARQALERLASIEHYKLGHLPQAQAAYRRLVRDYATTQSAPKAQLELVSVSLKLGDLPLARREAEKVIRRWPTREEARRARFEVGDLLVRERRFKEAIAAYEALIAEKPSSRLAALARFEIASALEASGETASALPYYYAALAEHPHPALVQHKIGRVRARIHNTLPTSAITNARAQARQRSTLPKGL